ncbi:MAG: DUF4390 domain-containing protein [Gammaproteobacteria bacterium]|nr:DUF4390 domain-containing protein [Gammaproteobacteria bacterium]
MLTGCVESEGDYGFQIRKVDVRTAERKLNTRFDQRLSFSAEAREALVHGVPLTIQVQVELRDANSLTLLFDDHRRFEIRYLPMLEDYQLRRLDGGSDQSFPRLRHALGALDRLDLSFDTGPLSPGNYELRTRTHVDLARLPAPMRLPARFSPQWQHDSRWSTWSFEISA